LYNEEPVAVQDNDGGIVMRIRNFCPLSTKIYVSLTTIFWVSMVFSPTTSAQVTFTGMATEVGLHNMVIGQAGTAWGAHKNGGHVEAKSMRKLERPERIVAVGGEGYFPVLIRLQNGELAAIVRGGARHVGIGGCLDIIKSNDGAITWSEPKTVVDIPPDSRNPAFG